MNPLWGLFFKDRYRTPFSVYKMSVAEVVFLGAIIFGIGFGVTKGVTWVTNALIASTDISVEAQ